jgi:hypothetical protein
MANSETAGVTNVKTASIEYAAGPVAATLARYDSSTNNASTILGAKYTVDKTGTTVFGMYSDDTVSGVSTTGKSVGVRQAINSQFAVLGGYGETKCLLFLSACFILGGSIISLLRLKPTFK